MIDTKYIRDVLADLVKINSVNPDLEENGPGEKEIGEFIFTQLQALGVDAIKEELKPNRVNVIGILKGGNGGKSLMLNAHMDTVGVTDMNEPFSARIEDNKLYGRGAYDMKASISAMLGVAKAIKENKIKLNGDLILSFVADEEYGSIGAQDLVKKYKTDACIVTEPTDLRICLGHRGFGVYEITTKGKIAHGGLHKEGIDANMKMGAVLHELGKLSALLNAQKEHPLFGQASLHVPQIQGGQSLFIYSGQCTIQVERRTLPGEKEHEVFQHLQQIIDNLSAVDKNFKATLHQVMWRNPHEILPTSPIVQSLITGSEKILHTKSEFIGHTWWEDSGLFGEAGVETVIIGPGGGGIHQDIEWVDLQSTNDLASILLCTSIHFCNT